MVNLIKVHAVQIARLIGYRILLVKKRRPSRRSGSDQRRKAVTGAIEECNFVERDISRDALKCNVPRTHSSGLHAPGKHSRILLRILGRGAIVTGEYRRTFRDISVRPDLGDIILRTEIDADRCSIL